MSKSNEEITSNPRAEKRSETNNRVSELEHIVEKMDIRFGEMMRWFEKFLKDLRLDLRKTTNNVVDIYTDVAGIKERVVDLEVWRERIRGAVDNIASSLFKVLLVFFGGLFIEWILHPIENLIILITTLF